MSETMREPFGEPATAPLPGPSVWRPRGNHVAPPGTGYPPAPREAVARPGRHEFPPEGVGALSSVAAEPPSPGPAALPFPAPTVVSPAPGAEPPAPAAESPPAAEVATVVSAPPVEPSGGRTSVTCPECGTVAMADLAKRDAVDFCAVCDYPLFWARHDVVRDTGDAGEWSLRRLPGTEGRTRAASVVCPHCSEPNVATSQVCIRCGSSLYPEPEPVAPAPVVIVAPEPVVEPPPQARVWWPAVGVLAALVIVIVALLVATV